MSNRTVSTTLYRLYGADGTLLYVGVASNPGRRWSQHAKDKRWWGEVASTTLEHFDERSDALAAEREAIRREHPVHNVTHRPLIARPPARRTAAPLLAAGLTEGFEGAIAEYRRLFPGGLGGNL